MRILRLNKQDTAGIEERQAAERPPPLSGEAGPERAGDRDRLGFVRPCSAGPYIPFVWIQNKRSVLRLTMAEKLKIISLGGLNEIGKNMTVYEYGGDIIVIDVGMGFPDDDMYGIDVVIPDFSYLIKNKDRIRGIFLTHGHEDHIGSIPYLLRDINVPIYATRMTAGLVKLKLEEHRLLDKTKLITCEAGEVVKAGKFSVEFIHVNHSIADAVAFAIKTPVGTCIHTGDFKIDSTPIQGGMIDLARLGELGKKGVLALLCDSTNVERPGYTRSERSVGNSFDALFKGCEERIIVTTFASNVDRLQQILFYRELGLELSAIRRLLDDPAFDREAALQSHLAALEARRARLDALILTVKKTLKGASMMSDLEKFECFKQKVIRENEETYGAEVCARYGNEVMDRANARTAQLTQEQYWAMATLEGEIRTGLEAAVRSGADPAGDVGLDLAMRHKAWLSHSWEERWYSPEAHRMLAAMYTEDERFTAYYDRALPGCAAFLRAAIEAHIQ